MLCITSIVRSIDIAVICLSFALKWRSITISIDRCRNDTTKCVSYSLKYILQYLVFNQNAMRPEICVHSWSSHLVEFPNANRLIRLHFLNKSVSIEIFVTAPVRFAVFVQCIHWLLRTFIIQYTYRFCVPAVQRFQYSECDCDENAPNWSLLCHTKHISFTNDFWSHRKMLPTIQLLFQKPSIENVPKNRTFNCIAAPKWAFRPLQKTSEQNSKFIWNGGKRVKRYGHLNSYYHVHL